MSLEKAVEALVDVVRLQGQQQSASINELRQSIEASNDRTEVSIDRLSGEITKLTVQVGSFASSINEIRALSRQILTAIEGERTVAMQQAQNIERQSENIAELIALAKQQQQTVDRLLGSATK